MIKSVLRYLTTSHLIDKASALKPMKKIPIEKRVKRIDKIAKDIQNISQKAENAISNPNLHTNFSIHL